MKLKVLGSSSSGNCYLLSSNNQSLLLECGLRYKDILKGLDFNIKDIVGCLVTHEHKDHSMAMRDLLKAGIDVYTSFGTAREIVKECSVIETYHRLKFIKSEHQFAIGEFTILPFELQHDAAEPTGFLIYHPECGKILFATDTYYIKYKFSGLNHIILECNYDIETLNENFESGHLNGSLRNRLLKSHMSLENMLNFLSANDLSEVKNIMLIHLSSDNSDSQKMKSEVERLAGKPTYIAEKGLEIELF